MGKVRKFHFKFGWNIGEYEKWFYDMSEKGLHLKKLGRIFATFEKGDESERLYRIYISEDKLSPSILENFKNKGWEFITSYGDLHIFSSLLYYSVTEIYDNPEEYSNRLIDKEKSIKKHLIFLVFFVSIFIGIMLNVFLSPSTTILGLISGQAALHLLPAILGLIELFKQIRDYRTIIKIRKSFIGSNYINHRLPWKKTRLINGTFSILSTIIKLTLVIVPSIQLLLSFNFKIFNDKNNYPIVRLSEVEQRCDFEDIESFDFIDHEWSILAPDQLLMIESESINNEKKVEQNLNTTLAKKSSSYMQTEYYKLTFRKMANGLIQEMIHDTDCNPKRIKDTNFSQLYIYEIGVRKEVFACWKNNVIHIKYHGEKDVNQIVSILSEKTYIY